MGSFEAVIWLLSGMACGLFGGLLAGWFWAFALRRGLLRQQLEINDLQERALSVKGKNAASKRWEEDKWMEGALKSAEKAPVQRYDNDPL